RQTHDLSGEPRRREFDGWWLRLVRTSADWYQELLVAFLDDDGRAVAQKHYPVLAGKKVELERPSKDAPPRYVVEMLEVVDRADTSSSFRAAGHATGQTALQLVLDGARGDHWLL